MISFYPGPSKVYASIPKYVREAYKEGVLCINHRSPEFMHIMEQTHLLLKKKLHIPEDYTIFFTSSATECWEIIAQSLIQNQSFHLYNGSFGEKWFEHTQKLNPKAKGYRFSMEESPSPAFLGMPQEADVICLTHNETSNGTHISNEVLARFRETFPDKLMAIDATSSMAGVHLKFELADIWYASVQKCFGLPAGMAIMCCSPKAVQQALQIGENNHYNSMVHILEQTQKQQTTHTPNVLNIYLLMKVLGKVPSITLTDKITNKRYEWLLRTLNKYPEIEVLVKNEHVRSKTVLTLKCPNQTLERLKKEAKEAGILLGNGYGEYKANTFRIANFPAITDKEISILSFFLEKFFGV
jgi:phosphoserine aminotransferase